MNKKFLNVFLFSALMLGATGTFTSCKDYDDDITNLQEQIDKLATADELKASVSDMNAAISQAKAEAEAKAAAAQSVADAAKAAAAQAQSSADAAQAAIDAANAKVAELEANGATKAAVEAAQEAADAAAAAASAADAKGEAAAAAAQAAADAAQSAADAAAENLKKINALDTRLTALETKVAGMSNEAIEADLSSLSKEVAALKADLEALIGEYSTMVTSISLYYANLEKAVGSTEYLKFVTTTEQTTKFGPKGEVEFKEGNIKTYTDSLVVRVSPTTAILNKENISLINSKGENLSEFVTVEEVKPYDELIKGWSRPATRAASPNNGLWKVVFKLKENYKVEDLAAAIEVPNKYNPDNAQAIRFAVAVKNTEAAEGAAERLVVSSYDVEVSAGKAEVSGRLNFTVSNDKGEDVSVNYVRNRYMNTEGYDAAAVTTEKEELIWIDDEKPATAENIVTKGDKANAYTRTTAPFDTDNRQWWPLLPTIKGQPINIKIDGNIKAFYVELDRRNAIESGVSEINAWDSYVIDNLNTVQYGNEGSITIQDLKNVAGDIIGFRVWAVNLDGTLVDPDGRAFYVTVGNVIGAASVKGSIVASGNESDFIALEEGFFAAIAEEIAYPSVETKNDWNTIYHKTVTVGDNTYTLDNQFGYTFYKADKKTPLAVGSDLKDAAYVKFNWGTYYEPETWVNAACAAADYGDGQTYTQEVSFKNQKGNTLAVLTMEMTKTMPTQFPASFGAKDKQIINGVYTCYLTPENGWTVDTQSTTGSMTLASAFNGLTGNSNFVFSFAGSQKVGDELKPVDVYTPYSLNISKDFIDNESKHATTVTYVYTGISTKKNKNGEWESGLDYPINWDTNFSTVYACWHSASKWDWASGTKADQMTIQYATGTTKFTTALIKSTNSYNGDFTLTLAQLLTGANTKYLKLVQKGTQLVSVATGIADYFDVQVDATAGTLKFVPITDDDESNPKDKVASKLTIMVEDCYGCQFPITVDFTVLPK